MVSFGELQTRNHLYLVAYEGVGEKKMDTSIIRN